MPFKRHHSIINQPGFGDNAAQRMLGLQEPESAAQLETVTKFSMKVDSPKFAARGHLAQR
jgi:hypothetical protein